MNSVVANEAVFFHKGCGGEIRQYSCQWDDCFLGCSECDQHEHCDGFEMEEIA